MTNLDRRRSIRMAGYDYTQNGAYFVTICTSQRESIFGKVINGMMVVNEYGWIVQKEWERTAKVRPNIELDVFIVMPNHIHGIILIHDQPDFNVGATRRVAPTLKSGSLGAIIGQFKSIATKYINRLPHPIHNSIWQRNYYERIIRHENELNDTRLYILSNPMKWSEDELYQP